MLITAGSDRTLNLPSGARSTVKVQPSHILKGSRRLPSGSRQISLYGEKAHRINLRCRPVIAAPWREDVVLRIAYALETAGGAAAMRLVEFRSRRLRLQIEILNRQTEIGLRNASRREIRLMHRIVAERCEVTEETLHRLAVADARRA